LTLSEGAEFIQQIDEAMERAYQDALKNEESAAKKKRIKRADPPYQETEDEEHVEIGFKMKASGVRKKGPDKGSRWERRPLIVDAKGIAIPANKTPRIGGGSIVKVSFEMGEFYTKLVGAGVSLRLAGVQVIKLVEWGVTPESLGFEAEEDDEAFDSTAGSYSPAVPPTEFGDESAESDDDTEEEAGEEASDDIDDF
jgi:hypothetical protein